jgi:hypothetical protein
MKQRQRMKRARKPCCAEISVVTDDEEEREVIIGPPDDRARVARPKGIRA